jgi:hypothetical protein
MMAPEGEKGGLATQDFDCQNRSTLQTQIGLGVFLFFLKFMKKGE